MKSKSLSPSGTSLASVESLSMPPFQEVVLSSDIGCSRCQKRLADMMSKMGEWQTLKELAAHFCEVNSIKSLKDYKGAVLGFRDIESVVVNASEKKVTLICRYPSTADKVQKNLLVPAVNRNPLNKFALIKRLIRSSSS